MAPLSPAGTAQVGWLAGTRKRGGNETARKGVKAKSAIRVFWREMSQNNVCFDSALNCLSSADVDGGIRRRSQKGKEKKKMGLTSDVLSFASQAREAYVLEGMK